MLGTEGQYSWLGKSNLTATFPGGYVYTNDQRGLGSITARIGYTWGPGLVYVKGGYAYSDNSERVTLGGVPTAFLLNGNHSNGWTVGTGVEYSWLAPNWSVKGEYMYYDFGSTRFVTPAALAPFGSFHHRRPHAEARRQLSLQLRKPRGRTLLSACNCELRKAGFHAGLLLFGDRFPVHGKNRSKASNPLSKMRRKAFRFQTC